MNITKKLLPTIALLLLAAFSMTAQRGEGREMDAEKMADRQTEHMSEQLTLSEKQKEKIKEINLKYAQERQADREKMRAEREQQKAERTDRRTAFKATQDAQMAEYKQVLTAEQFAQLEKTKAERAEHRGHRRGGKRGDHARKGKDQNPTERAEKQTRKMTEQLGLNDEQSKALQQLNLEYAEKRKALFEKNKDNREANRKEMKQLKDDQKAATSKILTPEQMKQLEEMKPEHGRRGKGHKSRGDGRM